MTYKSAVTNNFLFHSLNIHKIRDIYKLELAKFMYKYHSQMLPNTSEKYFNSTATKLETPSRKIIFCRNYEPTKVKIVCNLLVFKYGILYSMNDKISAAQL